MGSFSSGLTDDGGTICQPGGKLFQSWGYLDLVAQLPEFYPRSDCKTHGLGNKVLGNTVGLTLVLMI